MLQQQAQGAEKNIQVEDSQPHYLHPQIYNSQKTKHLKIEFYECPYPGCKKSFSEKGNLIVHMRKHSGDKPYKCQFCEKTFPSIGNCKDHERRHLKIRPYQCSICQTVYYRNYQLVKHIVIKHPDKKTEECILKLIRNSQYDSEFQPRNQIVNIMTQLDAQPIDELAYLEKQSKTTKQNAHQEDINQFSHQEFQNESNIQQIAQNVLKIKQKGKGNILRKQQEKKKVQLHYKNKNKIHRLEIQLTQKAQIGHFQFNPNKK
eukprot:403336326